MDVLSDVLRPYSKSAHHLGWDDCNSVSPRISALLSMIKCSDHSLLPREDIQPIECSKLVSEVRRRGKITASCRLHAFISHASLIPHHCLESSHIVVLCKKLLLPPRSELCNAVSAIRVRIDEVGGGR